MSPTLAELHDCFDLLAAGDVVVPKQYILLAEAGMLEYGASRKDWKDNLSHYLFEAPPAVLCHGSLEWHPPHALHMWQTPKHWNLPDLMAFAGNGFGDHWCWQRIPAAAEPRVLFCYHDEDRFEVFTADFDDFLARVLAESLAQFEKYDPLEGPNEVATHLRVCVRSVLPYLAPHYRGFFEAVAENELSTSETPDGVVYGLVDQEQLGAFLEPILAKPEVGKTSPYPKTTAST